MVGADAVYVKSWGSLAHFGRPEEERACRKGHRDWQLTADAAAGHPGGARAS